jgi:hypothetical protein
MTVGIESASPDLRSDSGPLLLFGEVHTGVLQNSRPITPETATELLALIADHPVRRWERPIRHAASGPVLTGVDGALPAVGAARRAIGTLTGELRITGGRLLQSSASAEVRPATQTRRLSWSHYLTRPGVLESFGAASVENLIEGFLNPVLPQQTLDVGGICVGLLGRAQSSPLLDRRAPFKARRTRLRWVASAVPDGTPAGARFMIEADDLRSLSLTAPADVLTQLPALCQTIALHDWLLTTVSALLDSADLGPSRRGGLVRQLQPAIDHLLHLWMPTARLSDPLLTFWHEIDRRSGLTDHWLALVQQIRDQFAIALLEHADLQGVGPLDLRARSGSPAVVTR